MNDDPDLEPLPGLPPELAELDDELRDLHIEERPSFAPELQAELERVWLAGPPTTSRRRTFRGAVAAVVGSLLFVGLAVPPARASLAELSRLSLELIGVIEEEPVASAEPPAAVVAVPEPAELEPAFIGAAEEPTPIVSADEGEGEEEADEGVEGTGGLPPFETIPVTFPELVDREADERAIRKYYPDRLRERGVGGTVKLRLWVDSAGAVGSVKMREPSDEQALDRAALLAARDLRFVPATRAGVPVGTWVEFDMVFNAVEQGPLPTVPTLVPPSFREGMVPSLPEEWRTEAVVPAPFHVEVEAQELLQRALGRNGEVTLPGSVEDLLAGEPPPGTSVLRWREQATAVLEESMVRDPDNPAPYLALARIRVKQGVRAEARALLEKGIERARRGSGPASPVLVAELHYELGRVLKDRWLAWRDVGEVDPSAVENARCAGTADEGAERAPIADEMIGLNYLCPTELDRILSERFEPLESGSADHQEMIRAFGEAVEAHRAHVGANLELLLDLADRERWRKLLNEARLFAWASGGHPYSLLLSGLALQRLGRVEEAHEDFSLALRSLDEHEAAMIDDLGPLLTDSQRRSLQAGSRSRQEARAGFWRTRDPILVTDVNEREVEHWARAAYAFLRFGGVRSDPGEVWVRYGRPDHVRAVGRGGGLRTEFWDYGRGPDVTFRRPGATADLALTAEAKTFLEELRQVYPHRYGTEARTVLTLRPQLARFPGEEAGPGDIEIHGAVPPVLATGSSDTLDLGLFHLGVDGEILWRTERRIPATPSNVRLRTELTPGTREVVMELYHPGMSLAAAIRSPVVREEAEEPTRQGARMSDLLLVDPATPGRRVVTRRDPWMVPRTAPDDGSGDHLGVFFELYDIPIGVDRYTVRADIGPAGREGRRVQVPVRPSGRLVFERASTRTVFPGSDSVDEYLTLDLSDVPAGSHSLRLVVELPGGHPLAEATRTIQR